jgi:hypothetical protein
MSIRETWVKELLQVLGGEWEPSVGDRVYDKSAGDDHQPRVNKHEVLRCLR